MRLQEVIIEFGEQNEILVQQRRENESTISHRDLKMQYLIKDKLDLEDALKRQHTQYEILLKN